MNFARKAFCALFLLFPVLRVVAQQTQWAFRISFTDKNGAPSVGNAISYLSQRSLDRRSAMNIAVDSIDRPVSPAYIDSVLTITGGKRHVTSRWLNDCVILLHDSSAVLQLLNKPYIRSIEAVGYFGNGLHRNAAPGKDKFAPERKKTIATGTAARTTGSPATYGYAYTQTAMVNGDYLHDHNLRGENKLIAIIDEGFMDVAVHNGFDSLRSSGRLLETYNFVLDTSFVYGFSDHGTAALSTMAGNIADTFLGAAPHSMYALYISEYMPAEMPVEMDQLVAALERADSLGADVATASLGYNTFDAPFESSSLTQSMLDGQSSITARGVNIAAAKGLLFVSTSGNEGTGGLLTPGDADSALTVGAVTPSGTPASFSSYGPNAMGIIKPDVSTMGDPAFVLSGTGSSVGAMSGTSFAGPQIAGWAACLLQGMAKGSRPGDVRMAIDRSADHYTNPGPQIGYGIPNFKIAALATHAVDTTPAYVPPGDDFINIWPTVFSNTLNIKVNADTAGTIQFRITDAAGRTFWHTAFSAVKGAQWFPLLLQASLPSGVYFFEAVGTGKKQVVRIVKD